MDLSRPEIEIRPRSHWEAADLGCLMARRWFVPLLGSWLVTAVPAFVLIALLLGRRPELALLLFWWFKPLYERLPLWLLSQAIFGDVPRLGAALRDWRRIVMPQLGAALSYRRLSPTRSFDTPVVVLERLRGRERGKRLAVLHQDGATPAGWLTVIGAHIEGFLFLSLVLLAVVLVPDEISFDVWAFITGETGAGSAWIQNVLYLCVTAVTGPVYVAAGFSLYLNRRVQLEAWDVELSFRQLLARWQRLQGVAALSLVVLLSVPITLWVVPAAAADTVPALSPPARQAEETVASAGAAATAEPRSAREASRARIEAVLAGPQFNEIVTYNVPVFLRRWWEAEDEPAPARDFEWIAALSHAIAAAGRVLMWVLAAALLVWVLVLVRRWADDGGWTWTTSTPQRSARIAALNLGDDAAELPDDVVSAARAAWAQRQHRRALALLLRGSLTRLMTQHACRFADGDTEAECLREVRRAAPDDVYRFVAALIPDWQRLAYAHRRPDDAAFDALCRQWPWQ